MRKTPMGNGRSHPLVLSLVVLFLALNGAAATEPPPSIQTETRHEDIAAAMDCYDRGKYAEAEQQLTHILAEPTLAPATRHFLEGMRQAARGFARWESARERYDKRDYAGAVPDFIAAYEADPSRWKRLPPLIRSLVKLRRVSAAQRYLAELKQRSAGVEDAYEMRKVTAELDALVPAPRPPWVGQLAVGLGIVAGVLLTTGVTFLAYAPCLKETSNSVNPGQCKLREDRSLPGGILTGIGTAALGSALGVGLGVRGEQRRGQATLSAGLMINFAF